MPSRRRIRNRNRVFLFSVILVACAARKESHAEPQSTRAAAMAGAAPEAEEQKPSEEPFVERKLIRDAELHLEVEDYEGVRPKSQEALEQVEGYVADAEVDHEQGAVSNARLILRVPAEKLDGFIAACSKLGNVVHESVRTRDVSEEYYDSRARLTNA